MKKVLLVILSFFLFFSVQAKEWKNKNKWKISCGVVNDESLIVNCLLYTSDAADDTP